MAKIGILALAMTVCVTGVRAADVPRQLTHQGVIAVKGERYSGTGNFYFALVTRSTDVNLWTNDGSQLGTAAQPDTSTPVVVVNGVYSVALGQTPMPPIPSSVFENNDVLLRIWFDDGAGNGVHQLTPDQVLNSAPYVFRALDSDRAADAAHADFADEAGVAEDSALLNGFTARQLTPAGSIMAFAGATAPPGWLLCNGSTVSRAANADLFAAIGTAYGSGDGSTTFHLPDLRGRFLRGVTGGTANDPNAATRTASNAGGNVGNNIGSLQTDATSLPTAAFTNSSTGAHTHNTSSGGVHGHVVDGGSHTHLHNMRASAGGSFNTEPANGNPGASFLGLLSIPSGGSHSHNVSSTGSHTHTAIQNGNHAHTITGGDAESRPVNVYVNWIIKQ